MSILLEIPISVNTTLILHISSQITILFYSIDVSNAAFPLEAGFLACQKGFRIYLQRLVPS
jgi:hypothetical protein